MATIGFVGLGAMGSRIAGRLLDGNQVYGTNRTQSRAIELMDQGMAWRATPREVAAEAEVVFSMVTDDAALEAVTAGPDGILAGLAPGNIYVDMSTVSPQASRELAQRVQALGATLLDAPVSGSVTAAADGTLAIMVGGPDEAFDAVEPLLHRLGRTVTHVGPNGQALLLKLAINISLAAQILAFSEGVLLAERGGIDRTLAAQVMATSAIGSPTVQARVPLILDLPEQGWFDVELMHKDIGLVLEAADDLGLPVPSASVTDTMLTKAEQMGYAHRDIASLYEVLDHTAAEPHRPAGAHPVDVPEREPAGAAREA
ncbi:NAD(P)-dependent oxidoreductase [Streptomyces sp. NPDC060223]|uniref:NAD(P)-dependent oxidoreductase n=1 Tax=unclassified Streptomyces TaxID=2593676 RepID=UPI00363C26A6